jgi:hypothetical protein
MNKEEISKRFDTPSQLEYNKLRLENDIMRRNIHSNEIRMSQLHPAIEGEGNKAADKLDKDFPERFLAKHTLKLKEKQLTCNA